MRVPGIRWLIAGCLVFGLSVQSVGSQDASQPIRLSQVFAQVSQDPSFRERLLQSLNSLPKAWGLVGSDQIERLRNFILDRNWSAVDHFPGLTVAGLNRSVTVANYSVGKTAALHGSLTEPYVEVGSFLAGKPGEYVWNEQNAAVQEAAPPAKDIGFGLTMGDGPNPQLWPWHANSERLAFLLNRLSLNALENPAQRISVMLGNAHAATPEALMELLARSGSEVWVEDARFFANFGHLHYYGRDVLLPFWINTQISVPGTGDQVLVPVSHAEEEIHVRGPKGNADVSFYYGIDGMAEFRTMDTLDQAWVGKNVPHVYRGRQASEVVHLLGSALATYVAKHRSFPNLPFSGYYRLGVCQDVVAAIEMHFFGRTSLFPITHDPAYFRGNSEIEKLFQRLPNDRGRRSPEWFRVRGSLPVSDLSQIGIEDLRRAVEQVDRRHVEERRWQLLPLATVVSAVVLLSLAWAVLRRMRERSLS